MKLIDLLNKIANGEEVPKKIRITILDDRITRIYNFFYDEDDQEYKDDELFPLGARIILERALNEKVEIIEEDKDIEEFKVNKIMEIINERKQYYDECLVKYKNQPNYSYYLGCRDTIGELLEEIKRIKIEHFEEYDEEDYEE